MKLRLIEITEVRDENAVRRAYIETSTLPDGTKYTKRVRGSNYVTRYSDQRDADIELHTDETVGEFIESVDKILAEAS